MIFDNNKEVISISSLTGDLFWGFSLKAKNFYILGAENADFDSAVYKLPSLEEWEKRICPEDFDAYKKRWNSFVSSSQKTYEDTYRLLRSDGSQMSIVSKAFKAVAPNGDFVIKGLFRNISEQEYIKTKLYRVMNTDRLTRLHKVERLKEIFDEMNKKSPGQDFLLYYLDLDNFRYVNKMLGYQMGNKLLIEVGKVLFERYRHTAQLARVGADEFLILIEKPQSPRQIFMDLTGLLEVMSTKPMLEDCSIFLTCSIGVAQTTTENNSFYELVKNANTALFCAKQNGKNCFEIYNKQMDSYAYETIDMIHQIRQALTNKQFDIHFQPIINSADMKIFNYEALIRWHHPERGMIMPGDFIEIAESSGQIVEIEKWIFKEVFSRYARQICHTQGCGISINLSSNGLIEHGLVEYLTELLDTYKVDASKMYLEITESVAIKNFEKTVLVLKELKKLGFMLALDDFGTGYSSLHYLNNLPLDVVKLDRTFIKDFEKEEKKRLFISTVINLSHEINLKVVAEGIEEKIQQDLLKGLHCDYMQGYLFGKPAQIEK